MHALSRLPSPIPTLYVRSLSSFRGPEYSISSIFHKARQVAPCYLVFEDLDSIVTDHVRSYFLNEVDGLKGNDGILMIGSTNHLERLDPGISKRPSRFDRKYLFPDPDGAQRVEYCRFWRKKLDGSEDVEFPEVLDKPIARITEGFSFAYMQEAFVASLLAIAGEDGEEQEEQEEAPAEEEQDDPEAMFNAKRLEAAQRALWQTVQYQERPGRFNYYLQDGAPYQVGPNDPITVQTSAIDDLRMVAGKRQDVDLEKYVLWRQMKRQVEILRKELKVDD